MTDKAIAWLHRMRAQDADKPFFVYYSTGCSHAPHQVPSQWSDKYAGRFDSGWDQYREETFQRQRELGVIPPDAELTPSPANPEGSGPDDRAFPAWDSLREHEQRLYARQMEVYAGYQENADGTWAGSSTPSMRWGTSTTPSSSGSGETRAPAWRAPSRAPSTS